MICPKCGSQLDDDSKFCIFCGNSLDSGKIQPKNRHETSRGRETYPPRPDQSERKKTGRPSEPAEDDKTVMLPHPAKDDKTVMLPHPAEDDETVMLDHPSAEAGPSSVSGRKDADIQPYMKEDDWHPEDAFTFEDETPSKGKKRPWVPVLAGAACMCMIGAAALTVVTMIQKGKEGTVLAGSQKASSAEATLPETEAFSAEAAEPEQGQTDVDGEPSSEEPDTNASAQAAADGIIFDMQEEDEAAKAEEDLWPEDDAWVQASENIEYPDETEIAAEPETSEGTGTQEGTTAPDETAGSVDLSKAAVLGNRPMPGYVVGDGTALYYWRYTMDSYGHEGIGGNFSKNPDTRNRLIRRTGDQEEVVLEDRGEGILAAANGLIYFERSGEGESSYMNTVCVFNPQDRSVTELQTGNIRGITANGQYVVVQDTVNSLVLTIDSRTGQSAEIGREITYLADNNGRLYYSKADGTAHTITLCSINPDGTDDRSLFTDVAGDPITGPMAAQIYFPEINGEEYVYVSYGSIGGSGGFYQGGRVARVKPDGSGFEVLAGASETVNSDFTVNPDGSVQVVEFDSLEARYLPARYDGPAYFYAQQGTIYRVSPETGEGIPVMGKPDYASFSDVDPERAGSESGRYLDIASVDVIENMAFVSFRLGQENGENIGWRTGYDLVDGALFEKNLSTGSVSEYFRFTS